MNASRAGRLRIALGEYDTGWHDPIEALARADDVVRTAVARGSRLVVLPEMCTTGFTMAAHAYAEPLDGPSVSALRGIAAAHRVSLIAGLAIAGDAACDGRAVNAAVLFGDDGVIRACYRKQRLFAYAGEDRAYCAGNEPLVVTVSGVRLAVFICYDLRFPELFRQVAPAVDAMVVLANWPAARRAHWDVLIRARAIENQCYVVAVNRTGQGGGVAYDGGSAAFDPWGEACATGESLRHADVDPDRVSAIRQEYPFLEDCRAG